MGGMEHGGETAGDGRKATAGGITLAPKSRSLPAGEAGTYQFRITKGDAVVQEFERDQTKLMHFYLVRSDLTGFQHVHPRMADDGTWTADLAATPPGSYRAYAQFITTAAGEATTYTLGSPVRVAGEAATKALPEPATTTEVDGYTVSVDGEPMSTMAHDLKITVEKDGRPVDDLEPYLDTYAHVTAFHAGDGRLAHLHPKDEVSGTGGPELSVEADLPAKGEWRTFIQFQTDGELHTAELTLDVG